MAEQAHDEKNEPETGEAPAVTTGELEDLEPSQHDSEAVKGGSTPVNGWNRVKNIP